MSRERLLNNTVAQFVSLVLNAPAVASFTFLILLAQDNANFPLHLTIALAFGTAIPLTGVYYLSRTRTISDICVSQKESRTQPFITGMASYLIGSILLRTTGAPSTATALMVCYLGNSLIMMLVSFSWKISVHASGITGPATVLVYSLGPVAFPFFLLAFPVGWARMKLGAHSLAQVAAGALLTILTTWLQLVIIL